MIMELLTGAEHFTSNGKDTTLTIRDFWSFQFSNILHDPDEIAEFLVAKALGLKEPCNKDSWTLYDIDYRGRRIEVKQTAYYHSFNEPGKVSNQRTFSIRIVKGDDGELARQNDIYVFCLLKGDNPVDAWPLELSHWEFYVVPTAMINARCGEQKTLSLTKVKSFVAPVGFAGIKLAVDGAIV